MKNKNILLIFLVGMVITILGALFKITHWRGADALLCVGMVIEAVAGIVLIVKLIKGNDKSAGFWDS